MGQDRDEMPHRQPPLTIGGAADPFLRHIQPLLQAAREVAIVAAFVQDSGVQILNSLLRDAIRRGATVRILTSDYCNITQPQALSRLLNLMNESAAGVLRLDDSETPSVGRLHARIVNVADIGRGFHPKSWRFAGPGMAVAFVGSSNLSRPALLETIEWNLRVDRERDPFAYQQIERAFEATWPLGVPLTATWIATYAERVRTIGVIAPPDPVAEDHSAPEPHELQVQALTALKDARAAGRSRALVVLATGLGKTLLAALDVDAVARNCAQPPRVLILAHREELLTQAEGTLLRVLGRRWPTLQATWYAGAAADLSGDIVLGSVSKLGRREHLDRLAAARFDYAIVDEAHHTAAASYRRILDRLKAGFLLGLTATPDRADQQSIAGLFDHFTAYNAGLAEGIRVQRLVPFTYHGIPDAVDYQHVNWRDGRFLTQDLTQQLATSARMERLWERWSALPGTRTLVFCCSVEHARFARDWLKQHEVSAEAVHSGPDSYDRKEALRRLESGDLQALCTVDLFNEGIDAPRIDRVVMLRPTESSVVFLQQLGRGLRAVAGKTRLVVIDFVGNHRVFLDKLRTLLALQPGGLSVREFLQRKERAPLQLSAGCLLDIPVEALEMLSKILPDGGNAAERIFRELLTAWDERPTAEDLWLRGFSVGSLRGKSADGWFEFVEGTGALSQAESAVLQQARDWLRRLEMTQVSECFPLVALHVMVQAGTPLTGLSAEELAARGQVELLRIPELRAELPPQGAEWLSFWTKHALEPWLAGKSSLFRMDGGRFLAAVSLESEQVASFTAMLGEIVGWRLAQYLWRPKRAGEDVRCKLFHNEKGAIIKLSRGQSPATPTGETVVRLPDDSLWLFRFMKEAVNVAHPLAGSANELPALLRGWFGEAAGKNGADLWVCFEQTLMGWTLRPLLRGEMRAAEPPLMPRRERIRYYRDLRVAAGLPGASQEGEPDSEEIELPIRRGGAQRFAVRAAGLSMDPSKPGKDGIHNGDYLVMERLGDVGLRAVMGRVVLLVTREGDDYVCQVKRIKEKDGHPWICSDNTDHPAVPSDDRMSPMATVVQIIPHEELVT